MNARDLGRGPVNELATLARRLAPAAYGAILEAFPQFRAELERGPDAGAKAVTESDRQYYEDRAALARQLAAVAGAGVDERVHQVVVAFNRLQLLKTVLAVISALAGSTTLVALGVDHASAIRATATATALVAVVNAAVEPLTRRFSLAQVQKANELRHAALVLAQKRDELALMVDHQRALGDIVRVIEDCNKYAMELNLKKQQLGLA